MQAVGVTDAAIEDAIRVCTLFSTITRIADALGFDIPAPAATLAGARMLLKRGYLL